jgi:formate transporter
MAKGTKSYADAALTLGVTPEKLAHLNWGTFALNNLVPVTLGNIVGGGIFVAAVYWFIYLKKNNIADVHRNRKAI